MNLKKGLKSKILSGFLTLAMVLSMIPMQVFAEGNGTMKEEPSTETLDFESNPESAIVELNKYKTGSELSTWDSSTNTLNLNGVDFTTSNNVLMKLPFVCIITLKEGTENTFTSTTGDKDPTINCQNLTFNGGGTFNLVKNIDREITGWNVTEYFAIRINGKLTIDKSHVNINITGTDNVSDGIRFWGVRAQNASIERGRLTISTDLTNPTDNSEKMRVALSSDNLIKYTDSSDKCDAVFKDKDGDIVQGPTHIFWTNDFPYAYMDMNFTALIRADFTADDNGQAAIDCLNQYKNSGASDSEWDPDSKTLTLNGVTFKPDYSAGIILPAGSTIILSENTKNEIINKSNLNEIYLTNYTSSQGIHSNGDLTIKGTGSLTTSGNSQFGIFIEGMENGFTIQDATVNALGMKSGVYTRGTVTVNKGLLTAKATNASDYGNESYGIYSEGYTKIEVIGGSFTASGFKRAVSSNCHLNTNNKKITLSNNPDGSNARQDYQYYDEKYVKLSYINKYNIRITSQPTSPVNMFVGETCNLLVEAEVEGNPDATIYYNWYEEDYVGLYSMGTTSSFTVGYPFNTGVRTLKYICRVTADDCADVDSNVITVNVKKQAVAWPTPADNEGYIIDYNNETIGSADGYELSLVEDFSSLLPENATVIPNTKYYVRKKGDSDHNNSVAANFTTPTRPVAPDAVTVKSKTDTTITLSNTATTQEYSRDNGVTWIDGTGSDLVFEGLDENKDYDIVTRVKATDNSFSSENSAATTVKTKIRNTWTTVPTISDWTYGEPSITPTCAASQGDVVVEYKLADDNDNTYTTNVPSQAGNYTVRFTVGETDNYAGLQKELTFEIKQRKVNISWGPTTFIYNGKEQAPTATATGVMNEDTVTVTVTVSGEHKDANTYRAVATIDNANYKLSTNTEKEFTIQKATPTIVWEMGEQEVTYTGESAVITTPTVTLVNNETFNGTISYAYKEETTGFRALFSLFEGYTDGLPTEAGNYKIKAFIAENENYNSATTDIKLIINKADQNTLIINPVEVKTYGDANFELSTTGGSTNEAISYVVTEGNNVLSISGNTVTILKQGNAKVKATMIGNDNYSNVTSEEITIIVNKASPNVVVTAVKKEPGFLGRLFGLGNHEDIITLQAKIKGVKGEKPTGKVTFKYNNNEIAKDVEVKNGVATFDWVNPNAKTDYTITAYFTATENTNYNSANGTSDPFDIDKATPNLVINNTYAGKTYDEKAISNPKESDMTIKGTNYSNITFYYSNNQAMSSATTIAPTNAGTYYVTASVDATDNYNEFTSEPRCFVIRKKDVEAPEAKVGYNIDYNNETIAIADGYQVSLVEDFATVLTGNVPVMPNTKYYVRKIGDSNHNDSAAANFTTPTRPVAPDAVTVKSKTDTTITLSNTATTQEYSRDNGVTWIDGTGSDLVFEGLDENKDYDIVTRVKATDNSFFSENSASTTVKTKTAPAVAPDAKATKVTANQIILTENSLWEYSKDGETWTTENEFTNLNPQTKYTYYVRVKETDTAMPSQVKKVTATTAYATPFVEDACEVNYGKETITINDGYQVSTSENFENDTLLTTGTKLDPNTKYYVRKKGDSNYNDSAATDFTTPARPELSKNVFTKNEETIKGKEDASLAGLTDDMEYKLGEGEWITVTDDMKGTLANPENKDVAIRLKATDSAPCGEEASFTFAPSNKTLTVTFVDGTNITGISYNDTITEPAKPTKDGYYFAGWFTDREFKSAYNFKDAVTKDFTLYPYWVKNVPLLAITGTITQGETKVAGARVELRIGTKIIASTTTAVDGTYTFYNVPSGEYNVVVTMDGKEQSSLVTISDTNTSLNVTLPDKSVNSKVDITENTVNDDNTGTNTEKDDTHIPSTGDKLPIGLLFVLVLISEIGFLYFKKRKEVK